MLTDTFQKIIDEFRAYCLEEIDKPSTGMLSELYQSIGVSKSAITFERILTKHLTEEIKNDIDTIDNLLNTTNPSPQCRRAEDR